MTYTVGKLITNAYYTSGIVARNFQTVDGNQMQDGFDMLNDILGESVTENDMIPYYSDYKFAVTPNQESYFIPNLVKFDTLVFYIQQVRYSMTQIQRRQYFGTARANSIQSLPFTYHTERTKGGSTLWLYFLPDQHYPMEGWGLFSLTSVRINQVLDVNLTQVNLGYVTIQGAGIIIPGQFVINGTIITGNFATPAAVVAGINAQANVTGVNAVLNPNQLYLTSANQIELVTNGLGNVPTTVQFSNFNTVSGNGEDQIYYPLGLDQFYISYLKYRLAERLCIEYDYTVPAGVSKILEEMQEQISKRSQQIDLKNSIISTLGTMTSLNYAQVNLGRGWSI